VRALGPLYKARWSEKGEPLTKSSYVRIEEAAARLLSMDQGELESLFDRHPGEALEILTKLVKWLSMSQVSSPAAAALASLRPSELPSVTSLLGLAALKEAADLWENHKTNGSEDFWQKQLSQRAFVLSQLFAHPVVVVQEQAYLGGKSIDNTGGSYLDFLVASSLTNSIALVEIKSPTTDLLRRTAYRGGAFAVSAELSGAVAQVLKYRRTFTSGFAELAQSSSRRLIQGSPRCIVIAGSAETLATNEQTESFESFRGQLSDVAIVTFDELFARVKTSVELLSLHAG
jgi:hypothetical protein